MDLRRMAEMYALDMIHVDDLPIVAADVLEDDHDSPSLRQLAGLFGADSDEIRRLFHKSLDELSVPIPSPIEAGCSFARRIASDIVQGIVAPYDGARQIWTKIYIRFPQLIELRPFVGFASEYEDDEIHREDYSKLIIEESKRLLEK